MSLCDDSIKPNKFVNNGIVILPKNDSCKISQLFLKKNDNSFSFKSGSIDDVLFISCNICVEIEKTCFEY